VLVLLLSLRYSIFCKCPRGEKSEGNDRVASCTRQDGKEEKGRKKKRREITSLSLTSFPVFLWTREEGRRAFPSFSNPIGGDILLNPPCLRTRIKRVRGKGKEGKGRGKKRMNTLRPISLLF